MVGNRDGKGRFSMSLDIGLLVLRLVFGLVMFGYGAQKLFGWFGGKGFVGTRSIFGGTLRLRPAGFWTLAVGASEAGGGLLFALGLLNPLGAVMIAAMLIAVILVTYRHFWGTQHGFEPNLLYVAAAAAVGVAGPGKLSLDAALGIALPEPITFIAMLILALIGIVVALATRAPSAAAPQQATSATADATQVQALGR